MSESWLEIRDPDLDAQEIERRIEARMARRGTVASFADSEDVEQDPGEQVAESPDIALPAQEAACNAVARWLQECDVVPANYVIDWRVPIIGPIHAAVRRVIHTEVRRFVLSALVKQSHLNRAVLQALNELCQENARLRQELAELRQDKERDQ
jgi:hypothetical protein